MPLLETILAISSPIAWLWWNMRDPAGFGQLSRLRRRKHDAQAQKAGQETRIERLQSDLFGFTDKTTIQNHSNGFMLTVCFHHQFLQSIMGVYRNSCDSPPAIWAQVIPVVYAFECVSIAGHGSPSAHQRTCLPCLYLKARYISVHHLAYGSPFGIWWLPSTGNLDVTTGNDWKSCG